MSMQELRDQKKGEVFMDFIDDKITYGDAMKALVSMGIEPDDAEEELGNLAN